MTEKWSTFPAMAPYEVSNLGRVRSPSRLVPYKSTGGFMRLKDRILKQQAMPKGHMQVTLLLPSGKKTFSVHRLVLEAFVGPSPLGTRHLNDQPADNRLVNIVYGTQLENMQDRQYLRGSSNPLSSTTAEQELTILSMIEAGYSMRSTAKLLGVSREAVKRVTTR